MRDFVVHVVLFAMKRVIGDARLNRFILVVVCERSATMVIQQTAAVGIIGDFEHRYIKVDRWAGTLTAVTVVLRGISNLCKTSWHINADDIIRPIYRSRHRKLFLL
jgi:hypothetical protein